MCYDYYVCGSAEDKITYLRERERITVMYGRKLKSNIIIFHSLSFFPVNSAMALLLLQVFLRGMDSFEESIKQPLELNLIIVFHLFYFTGEAFFYF